MKTTFTFGCRGGWVGLILWSFFPLSSPAAPDSVEVTYGNVTSRTAFTTSASARAGWTADSRKIRQMIGRAKILEASLESIAVEVSRLGREVSELRREKREAVDDMLAGRYCSRCGRSATQIERTGENFQQHLGRVSGRLERASPEQIAALEKSYDERIDPLAAKLSDLNDEERETKWKRQLLGSDIQIQRGFYHENISAEAVLRSAEWNTQKWDFEKQLYDLRENVQQAEMALRTNVNDDVTGILAMNVDILRRQFEDTSQRAQTAYKRADEAAVAFVRTAHRDIASLSEYARTLTHPHVLPTGWVIGGSLLKTVSCSIYPVTRIELSAGSLDTRSLLETARPRQGDPAETDRAPSIRELLEGR